MNILYHFHARGTGPEAVHIAGIAIGLPLNFSSIWGRGGW